MQVQEAFAYGISAELTRLRTAEKVRVGQRDVQLRHSVLVSDRMMSLTKKPCLCRCLQTHVPQQRLCRSALRVLLPSRSSRLSRTICCLLSLHGTPGHANAHALHQPILIMQCRSAR